MSDRVTAPDPRRPRVRPARGTARVVLAALAVLLLALVGLALFWPVPGQREGDRQGVGGLRSEAGSVTIVDAQAWIAEEVPLGRRALPLAVSVTLRNTGPARTFDPTWLRVEVDTTTLLPLSGDREGVARVVHAPHTLDEGVSGPITVVFAVPAASTEVTVVVQPGDVRPDRESRAVVEIPEKVER